MRPSPNMLTDVLTIVTPGSKTNRAGDEIPDWDEDAVTTVTTRGRISQRSRSEDNTQRTAQIGEWTAYLPPGTAVDGRCRVEHAGRTFDVVGPPYEPTTGAGVGHIEITLRLVEG